MSTKEILEKLTIRKNATHEEKEQVALKWLIYKYNEPPPASSKDDTWWKQKELELFNELYNKYRNKL